MTSTSLGAATLPSPVVPARSPVVAVPPLAATGFLRQPQVLRLVPVSKSTLWRRVAEGTFPAPVKLFARVTAWRVEDVHAWIEAHAVVSEADGLASPDSGPVGDAATVGPRRRSIRNSSRPA